MSPQSSEPAAGGIPGDLGPGALAAARSARFGSPVRALATTGSTNSVALEWAAQGAPEGALVVADHQSAGRGRLGRAWLSSPGCCLLFSLVLRPAAPLDDLGALPVAVGVAAAEAVARCARVATGLKWPNDITVDGRKLGGILVESRTSGPGPAAVVAGVGINVGWRAEDIPADIGGRATSIAAEAGTAPGRAELLGEILAALEDLYPASLDEAWAAAVARAHEARSELIGREVAVRLGAGGVVSGRAVRVLASGALEIDAGRAVIVGSGEVEAVRQAGA